MILPIRWHVWMGTLHVAFNDYVAAMLYAQRISTNRPDELAEVITRGPQSAMYGQYRNGRTTPEFISHHRSMLALKRTQTG